MDGSVPSYGDKALTEAINRLRDRITIIEANRIAAAHGKVAASETRERKIAYLKRLTGHGEVAAFAGIGLEAAIGPADDIVSIEFLEAGQLAARPVGRVSTMGGSAFGSGFLVGEGLFLTNNHVLDSRGKARTSTVEFNYEEHKYGTTLPASEFLIEPDNFWLTDPDLDFTLVALSPFDASGESIQGFGWHPLFAAGKILQGMPVNIIQHPGGGVKSIALHNSYFLHVDDNSDVDPYCWYTGDTRKGSSGAPVFNNYWEVVALHHKAVPKVDSNGRILDTANQPMSEAEFKQNPGRAEYVANEGIRASRLLKAIEAASLSVPEQEARRKRLLALWASSDARFLKRRIRD